MVEKTVSVRRRSKNKVWFNEDHGKFKLRSLTGSSLSGGNGRLPSAPNLRAAIFSSSHRDHRQ